MRIKLNGWQRIGIVVSVIWFVGLGGYFWLHRLDAASENLRLGWRICESKWNIDDLPHGLDKQTYEQTRDHFKANIEECRKSETAEFIRRGETIDKQFPLFLAIDLGTVVLGWLVAWFGFVVVRWIGRGFQS